MGLSVEKLKWMQKISWMPLSLETPVGDDEESELGSFIEDEFNPGPAESTFQTLLKEKMGGNNEAAYLSPVGKDEYKVVYAIISRKEKDKKSANLPLFSRISLMRSIKALNLMNVKPVFCFVNNASPKKQGKKKPRKKAA